MGTVIVTGAAGLIGSSVSRAVHSSGYTVVGIDNDMRQQFFGAAATTTHVARRLQAELDGYSHHDIDIRDTASLARLIEDIGEDLDAVVHAAAQPSHDWSALDPIQDFEINAASTLRILECLRQHAPHAAFVFMSTNKVYGDAPNRLPLVEEESRWELDASHRFAARGIDETQSIDRCTHSPFGASKVAADTYVQEYGRYYGLKTTALRLGCITGPAHQGVELHGFLSYLTKQVCSGTTYKIHGYLGKQVRDNLHSDDLADAVLCAIGDPPEPGSVFNLGGGRAASVSVLEALEIASSAVGCRIHAEYEETNRVGDHMWWITDCSRFRARYPQWAPTRSAEDIIKEIAASFGTAHG